MTRGDSTLKKLILGEIEYEDIAEEELEYLLDAIARETFTRKMSIKLERAIRRAVEPMTDNMGLKHRDVMECIEFAYVLIKEEENDSNS